MSAYAEIDPAMDSWALARGLLILREWAGEESRFSYVGGRAPFECFQIAVDPPASGRVAVHAWSVDTNDGSEWAQHWEGSVSEIAALLEQAMRVVSAWREREKPIAG